MNTLPRQLQALHGNSRRQFWLLRKYLNDTCLWKLFFLPSAEMLKGSFFWFDSKIEYNKDIMSIYIYIHRIHNPCEKMNRSCSRPGTGFLVYMGSTLVDLAPKSIIASLPRRRGFTILRAHGCFPSLNMKLSGGARTAESTFEDTRDVWEI